MFHFLFEHWFASLSITTLLIAAVVLLVMYPTVAAVLWKAINTPLGRDIVLGIAALIATGYLALSAWEYVENRGRADQKKTDQLVIDKKDASIAKLTATLAIDNKTIADNNADAQKRIEEANKQKAIAIVVPSNDEIWQAQLKSLQADYHKQVEQAKEHPSCNALLTTNVAKVCGLSSSK